MKNIALFLPLILLHKILYVYIYIYIVGIGKKSYGFMNFRTLKNKLYNRFYPKKHLKCISTAVMMLYLLVKRSKKSNLSMYSGF